MLTYLYITVSILLIPCLILGVYAQVKVHTEFNKYKELEPLNKIDTQTATKKMLEFANLNEIKLAEIKGDLTDNYNPKTKTISLSDSTRSKSSVAGISVIAHEIGHAIQDKEGYKPLKIRNAIVPIIGFSSFMFYPLFIIGIILMFIPTTSLVGEIFIWIATFIYFLSTLFYLITWPVERDASKRALNLLLQSGTLKEEDIYASKKVLKAAELTYISALLTSFIYFLRFLLSVISIVKQNDN